MAEKAILEIRLTATNVGIYVGEVGTLYIAGWSVKLIAPLTNCMVFPHVVKTVLVPTSFTVQKDLCKNVPIHIAPSQKRPIEMDNKLWCLHIMQEEKSITNT